MGTESYALRRGRSPRFIRAERAQGFNEAMRNASLARIRYLALWDGRSSFVYFPFKAFGQCSMLIIWNHG